MKQRQKRICVITGTRAEYGLLKPVMREMVKRGLKLQLIVAGMHLADEFGSTARDIEIDGFKVDANVDMLFSRDANVAMAKSIGIGVYGISQALEGLDPDIVAVLGDRVEAFAGAISCAGSNKILAHIHGGERSRGGLDESMRHAITKLAHIHFTSTEANRERVIRLGENPSCVYNVGAPGLDLVGEENLHGRADLSEKLGIRLKERYVLAVQHPVSTESNLAEEQIRETLKALDELGHQVIFIYPNSDAGGRKVIKMLESYATNPLFHLIKNLRREDYLSLMKYADVLVGNSSSGIIEAPYFHLPVVNIGSRQEGRERAENVVDVRCDHHEIRNAIEFVLEDTEYQEKVRGCSNPYGDGTAGARIAEVLSHVEITTDLIKKQISY